MLAAPESVVVVGLAPSSSDMSALCAWGQLRFG